MKPTKEQSIFAAIAAKHPLIGLMLFFAVLCPAYSHAEMMTKPLHQQDPESGRGIESPYLVSLVTVKPVAKKTSDTFEVLMNCPIAYLRDAAEQGDLLAMTNLSVCLKAGVGVEKNLKESFQWIRKAADEGFSGAQTNLGDMYEKGTGVQKSYGDAIYWYTQAAMDGEPTAYLSLGEMFAAGMGVQKDLVESYFWLTMAIKRLTGKSNLQSAKLQRDKIEKLMTDQEISTAQRRAKDFLPLTQTEYPLGDGPEK